MAMRRLLPAVIALLGITSLATAGNNEEEVIKSSKQDAKIVLELRHLIATADQQLSSESSRIRLFAQLADKEKTDKEGYLVPSNKVVRVPDADGWPELTVTSYVILMRDDGTIAAFQEVPVSESGDWDNNYTHYYDKQGNTVAFKRDSSFFNGCPDSPSHEVSTYYYQDHRLLAKDYSLKGSEDEDIQPRQCEFMYRHEYTIHKTWRETERASGIAQVLH